MAMDESTIRGMKLLDLEDRESAVATIRKIRIRGESSKKNGSDMGGSKVVVKPELNPDLGASAKSCSSRTTRRHGTVDVTGYDHSLPEDDIERALIKHFSSCGEVGGVVVFTRICNARVIIKGEGAAEKALKLSGCNSGCECDVLGCKFVAHKYIPQSTVRGNESTGYTVSDWCIQKAAKRAKV